jgi:hypothetical protein
MNSGCAAALQGSNRLQRGLNYIAYLNEFFSTSRWAAGVATFGIFKGGHSSAAE